MEPCIDVCDGWHLQLKYFKRKRRERHTARTVSVIRLTHVQECWDVAVSAPLFVNYSLYTQPVIFFFQWSHIHWRSWIEAVRDAAGEGVAINHWRTKLWLWLIVCVCVTRMHEQHSPWLINVMVLAFTCTSAQFLSPFSCSPKCRVPTGDIQPPWELEVSCRGEHSISPPHFAICSFTSAFITFLLYIFTWRNSQVYTTFHYIITLRIELLLSLTTVLIYTYPQRHHLMQNLSPLLFTTIYDFKFGENMPIYQFLK